MHAGFCYSNDILEKSAKSVLEAAGLDNGKSVFLCSGSEAIEISRQMVWLSAAHGVIQHIQANNLISAAHSNGLVFLNRLKLLVDEAAGILEKARNPKVKYLTSTRFPSFKKPETSPSIGGDFQAIWGCLQIPITAESRQHKTITGLPH